MLDLHVGLNIDGIVLCLLMWLDLDLLGEITRLWDLTKFDPHHNNLKATVFLKSSG